MDDDATSGRGSRGFLVAKAMIACFIFTLATFALGGTAKAADAHLNAAHAATATRRCR